MLKMTWDDELANEAQKWADNCNLANNPHASSPSYGRVGQNIYASPDLENIVSNAIAIWDDERLIYHENGSCDITNACGHYTQVSDINDDISRLDFTFQARSHSIFLACLGQKL